MTKLTPEALDALLAEHQPSYESRAAAHCLLCRLEDWPCSVYLLASEVRDARPVRDAADSMALAYAGEMAAKSAGIEIRGFPLLDAYQTLMVALAHYEEGTK